MFSIALTIAIGEGVATVVDLIPALKAPEAPLVRNANFLRISAANAAGRSRQDLAREVLRRVGNILKGAPPEQRADFLKGLLPEFSEALAEHDIFGAFRDYPNVQGLYYSPAASETLFDVVVFGVRDGEFVIGEVPFDRLFEPGFNPFPGFPLR
jgi:hypothetical protein